MRPKTNSSCLISVSSRTKLLNGFGAHDLWQHTVYRPHPLLGGLGRQRGHFPRLQRDSNHRGCTNSARGKAARRRDQAYWYSESEWKCFIKNTVTQPTM